MGTRVRSWQRHPLLVLTCVCAGCGSSSSAGSPSGPHDASTERSTGDAIAEASGDAGGPTDSTVPDSEPGSDSSPSDTGSTADTTPADAPLPPAEAGIDAGPPLVDVYLATGYQNRRIASFDGTATWVNDVSDPPNALDDVGSGVAFGLGTVIVAGHTGIYTSTDAKNWTHLPAPLPQVWPGLGGAAAAFGNGTFVVVASNDAWTSPDGVTFTDNKPSDGGSMAATHWDGLAWGNGHFFAVGDSNGPGDRKASEDGITWHDYLQDSQAWGGVAFGQGVFVAVGAGGRRVWTTDGVTLNDVSDATLGNLNGVAFGGGQFVVAGAQGSATSPDGKVWTKLATIPGVGNYGGGLFLTTTWVSNILTSPTGATWTTVFSGAMGTPAFARISWGQIKGP